MNERKRVSFFVTDIGHDIVFEVIDSGIGIPAEKISTIFQKGFSTKGTDRGYGLANVKEMVDLLGEQLKFKTRKMGELFYNLPSENIERKYITNRGWAYVEGCNCRR